MNRRLLLFCILAFGGLLFITHAQGQSVAGTRRYELREPRFNAYVVETNFVRISLASPNAAGGWLRAWPEDGSTNHVEFGSRLTLQLKPGVSLEQLMARRPLKLARTINPGLFIVQAPDAWTALEQAQQLAAFEGVMVSVPVSRRPLRQHGAVGAKPNDPHFDSQWHLQNRDTAGNQLGVEMNVRPAWTHTRGDGVIIAVVDDGFEASHPELILRSGGMPHGDFTSSTAPISNPPVNGDHATAVAGLAAAEGNNNRGVVGVAPGANLASWVIFKTNGVATTEQLMDMFHFSSNVVAVQNHSWGSGGAGLGAVSALEQAGISNAIAFGRGGRGVVMVRAAGNFRDVNGDANEDAYPNDPRVIAVAAARFDGRAATYSNPGACLLVAAPSGDTGFDTLFTTDRQGTLGYNRVNFADDSADYAFNSFGFTGTSGATPQISGLCALMLSVNPNLGYRDVQQILVHAARHFDLADPDIRTNGAGFRFSHNVGFGIPDAGQAVRLAQNWINRPALTSVTYSMANTQSVPDDGLRVVVSGGDVPAELLSIPSSPSLGLHVDIATATVPVVDVGYATNAIGIDLTGKAALIRRGPTNAAPEDTSTFFVNKIARAAEANAAFAIVYNHSGTNSRITMADTDFVPIPAVFIGQAQGELLTNYVATNPVTTLARIELQKAAYTFNVTETLLCEHATVRVQSSHPTRGDLRITLVSPQGTRSVLQRFNFDTAPGPVDWTYQSTQHFYESSAGTWTVEFSDEADEQGGDILAVDLTIYGVAIADTDHDGLDDTWEQTNFGNLAQGPKDDPDGDGYQNAREQILQTNPNTPNSEFRIDIGAWSPQLTRLSWPAVNGRNYEVLAAPTPLDTFTSVTNITGRFPELEWFSSGSAPGQFFRVRSVSP
ncbi:MAG: S8 family serine peptidase [Verrucomicrobiota bacterium]